MMAWTPCFTGIARTSLRFCKDFFGGKMRNKKKHIRFQRPQNNTRFEFTNMSNFTSTDTLFFCGLQNFPFFLFEVNLKNAVSSRPVLAPWTEPYQRGERSAGHWAKLRAFVRARVAFRILLRDLRIREAFLRVNKSGGNWQEMNNSNNQKAPGNAENGFVYKWECFFLSKVGDD